MRRELVKRRELSERPGEGSRQVERLDGEKCASGGEISRPEGARLALITSAERGTRVSYIG